MSASNDLPPAIAETIEVPPKRPVRSAGWRVKWLLLVSCILIVAASGLFLAARMQQTAPPPGKVQDTPTSVPTPTSTLPATPVELFSDDFLTNEQGWYTGSASGYTRTLDQGMLTLSATNHKVLTENLPTSLSFDDFELTATFSLRQAGTGDSVGIYVRGDSNLDHDYRVEINSGNSYAISKESLATNDVPQESYLAYPTHTTALHPASQENTLKIIMRGQTLTFIINGKVVTTISDPDYTHGQIALFVENGPNSDGVTASFTEITVYTAPLYIPHA